MKFQYFTYFLNRTKQQSLFPETKSKKELFLEVIKQPLKYDKRGSSLGYAFIKQEGNFVIAKLGKQSILKRSLTPEKKFEEQNEENWPNCDIIFNTDDAPETGQRIAFETKSYVFDSPAQHLKYLAEELNAKLFTSGYAISINPITVEQKFWEIINTYKEKIQSLTFSYNAPNLFELKNNLNKELENAKETYGATKIEIGLNNPDGKLIIPENDFIKQSAEWVTKGGGEFTLKIKGNGVKKIISSGGNVMSKEFDDIEINLKSDDKDILKQTLNKILL